MTYTLSSDQVEALKRIGHWYKNKTAPFLTLGGYAGTGKTTLIAYLRQALNDHDENLRVAFCAFTGKATRLLDERLQQENVARGKDSVSTIHSLIYSAETDKDGHILGWQRKPELQSDIVIVDEASMVDETIWRDLLSYDVPILAVGDHGQLPPINSRFNLMAEPEIKLERIWRQAVGSPIIEMATLARMGGQLPVREFGPGVRKFDRADPEGGQAVQGLLESWSEELLVLCGYNHTRVNLNQAVRGYRGYESSEPQSGDRVICLRNNRFSKLFNGMTGTVKYITPAEGEAGKEWYEAQIALDNEKFDYVGYLYRPQFGSKEAQPMPAVGPDGKPGDLFDFGYALTVHKAQGSQARQVLLFEERFPKMTDDDWRRWLYTAVTRATETLTVVGGA